MNRRTNLVSAVAVLAMISGCTNGPARTAPGSASPPPASAAPSAVFEPTGDPMPALQAAYKQLATTSFRWETVTGEGNMTSTTVGAEDYPNRLLEKTINNFLGDAYYRRTIGTDTYVKGMDKPEDKWIHADNSKATGASRYRGVTPPNDNLAYVDIRQVDRLRYQASMDPAIALSLAFEGSPKPATSSGTDRSKFLPVTIQLDNQGRLSEIDMTSPVPGANSKTRYYDYGAKITVNKPPADDTIEAPESAYH